MMGVGHGDIPLDAAARVVQEREATKGAEGVGPVGLGVGLA